MSNEGIELEVYGYQDPLVKLGTIRDATSPQVLTEMGNVGGGSFSIHSRSKEYVNKPDWFKSRNVIKHRVNGKVIGGWLIASTNAITLDQTASVEGYEIAGEGLKSWLDDARIEPYGGFKSTSKDTRSFSFASEVGSWYIPSQWINPINQSRVKGKLWQYGPDKWPDGATGAYWVWGTANANPAAAVGDNYFRVTVPITAATAGSYNLYIAVDDNYAVYLDGTEIARYDDLIDGWKEAKKISMQLDVGTHVIGVRASNYRSAAGLVAALFRVKDRTPPVSVGTVTIPIGTTPTLTSNNHGLSNGSKVYFTTTGSLPAGLSPNKDYWVTQVTTNTFKVSNSKGGPSINTSGSQSGTHTVIKSEVAETEVLVTYSGMSPSAVNTLLTAAQNTVNTRQTTYNNLPAGNPKGNNTQKKQAAAKAKALAALNLAKQERDKLQTEYNIAVAAQSAGITWKVLPYPAKAPGWTPGEILLTLLNEAKLRNVRMASIITPNFTSTLDSNGQPWSEPLEWSFTIGSDTILNAVSKMEELACDVWIDPDTYQLNVVNTRGIDRTDYITAQDGSITSPVIFRPGKNLRRTALELRGKIKNNLAIKGETGWFSTPEQDTASVAEYGALESVLDTNASASVSKTLASMVFLQRATEEEGASYDIYLPPTGKTPFVDFNVGDWVLAPNKQGLLVKRRIMSISTEANSVGMPIYTIEFDTIFRDNEDRINRVLEKLGGNGVASSFSNAGGVGSKSPSAPEVLPGNNGSTAVPLEPRAPTDLEVMTIGYWSPNGVKAYGQVILSWAPVVEDTADNEIIPSEYQVWGRQTDLVDDAFALYGSSVQPIATMDGFEPGTNWSYYVVAINNGVSGEPSEIITVDIDGPVEPMIAPTAPIPTTANGNVILTWDQKMSDGNPPPMHFRYLYAEYRTTTPVVGNWIPVGTTLNREGKQITLPNLPIGAAYDTRFVAVDGAGIKSAPSASAPITVKGVDLGNLEQQVKDAIQAAQDAADAAAGMATDAETAANLAKSTADAAKQAADGAVVDIRTAMNRIDLVNNVTKTGTLDRWTLSTPSSYSSQEVATADINGVPTRVHSVSSGGSTQVYSDYFDVDPTKAYEFHIWLNDPTLVSGNQRYLGLNAANDSASVAVKPVNFSNGAAGADTSNFYFMYAAGVTDGWTEYIGYVLPYGTDPIVAKGLGKNILSNAIFSDPNTNRLRMRWLNWGNTTVQRVVQASNMTVTATTIDAIRIASAAQTTVTSWTKTGTTQIDGGMIYADSVTAAQIAANAVTVNELAANAVIAAKIATGAVETDKLAANAVTAAKIAAGTIATSKMMVTNLQNLVEDGSFEYYSTTNPSWTLAGGAIVDTVNPRTGTKALKVTTTAAAFVAATQVAAFQVEEGQKYRIEGFARLDSGVVAGSGLIARFNYGATEATTNTTSADIAISPDGLTTTYDLLSGVWTVPAGAKWARILIVSRDVAAGKVYRLDDLAVYKMTSGELLVDGVVTADKVESNAILGRHIKADAIDASHIQADAVTAEALAADSVTARQIAAGAIESNHLTAGSIKTSHISSEVGEELTLTSNEAIKFIVGDPADPSNPGLIPGLQGQLNDTNAGIGVMQQYYDFGPEGAVISKPGSVFATRIDNDSIDMLENGNVISYWNSGTLYVTQMIGERVTLGNHQIARLDPSIDPSSTVIRYIPTV